MKRLLAQLFVAFILTGILNSCRLEDDSIGPNERREILIESLHNTFFQFNLLGGTESEDFSVENDGMHGIYGLSRSDSDILEGNDLILFSCIRSINLSLSQLVRVRTATNNFSECRNANSQNYRIAIRTIINNLSDERRSVLDLYLNGKIDLEELENRLVKLHEIGKSQIIDEKLKNSINLRECLSTYIENIERIMNQSQWLSFELCILS
ncbi:hypothetical protein [Mongoliitalea lutea]|uniref:Uncharacterized protein n=1 Tax=Mongoliitalea lutea TaxID=849756 RepID=A0A8J3G4B9_9BACT|nr:hypothetical protein [Mongoliitalea lutea]GHB29301.1 hypothetical protein GCM10008106_07770 [Mongoliitalea lutea]